MIKLFKSDNFNKLFNIKLRCNLPEHKVNKIKNISAGNINKNNFFQL